MCCSYVTYGTLDDGLIHDVRERSDEVRREDLRIKEHFRTQKSLIPHVTSIGQSCRLLRG